MLINGRWVAAAGEAAWSHLHPATGEEVATFPVAGPADVDLAVRAARRAFDEGPWPRAGPASGSGCRARSPTWSGPTAMSC
jgi:aldehyde dehydrogenase (NAD+)